MIRAIVQRAASRAFQRSFIVVMIAQVVTIFVAWRLLDFNVNRWVHAKAVQTIPISQRAASSGDWSRIGSIPKERASKLGDSYQEKLYKLSTQYFLRDEGSVYLVTVEHGEEYDVISGNPFPLSDGGRANQWELKAYATRRATYTPAPITDEIGTYVAAYTPILRNGKVVGLVAAEYDSAPLSDFQSIVQAAFWFSIIPAILVSLVVAYILASWFVEPIEFLRTAKDQLGRSRKGGADDPWNRLTPTQRKVAELSSLTNRDIADRLIMSAETVKSHFKGIKQRVGLSKDDLRVQVMLRELISSAESK